MLSPQQHQIPRSRLASGFGVWGLGFRLLGLGLGGEAGGGRGMISAAKSCGFQGIQ